MKVNFGLRLKVWIHYPDGTKKKIIDRRSRSFVRAFIDLMFSTFRDSAYTFKNTSGTDAGTTANMQVNAPVGDVNYGIVVGNGYAEVTPENYALNARMANGVGAGQMAYQLQMWDTIKSPDTTKRYFEIYRYFGNVYTLPQIIREVAIYVKTQGGSGYYCFARDLLGAVEIPPNGGITVIYRIEIML
jgi:hypothetical protein